MCQSLIVFFTTVSGKVVDGLLAMRKIEVNTHSFVIIYCFSQDVLDWSVKWPKYGAKLSGVSPPMMVKTIIFLNCYGLLYFVHLPLIISLIFKNQTWYVHIVPHACSATYPSIVLVWAAEFWRYQPQRCRPSLEYSGATWMCVSTHGWVLS